MRENIARIVDGSDMLGFKDGYGAATVCVHAEIAGHAVGIISNNGPIDADGAAKAAQFIQLQCQAGTPVVFLQNTTGYLVGTDAEQRGIIKHGSKMIQAVTNMTVPKITLAYRRLVRRRQLRHVRARLRPCVHLRLAEQPRRRNGRRAGGENDAHRRRRWRAGEGGEPPNAAYFDAMAKTIIDKYDEESRALFATARLWDDGLIDPRDSRKAARLLP